MAASFHMRKPKQKSSLRTRVRHALYSLGMQAKAKEVVDALARFGLSVSEGFVQRVRIEELKGRQPSRALQRTFRRSAPRHHLQKIPQKRPWRR